MPDGLSVDRTACRDLASARTLEWLVANGRGGYAMGTVPQLLARRYHGLLVAAVRPPTDRWVLLAKYEAAVIAADRRVELGTNDYPGTIHPEGYRCLESFRHSPVPTWRWRVGRSQDSERGEVVIEQTLFLAHGADTVFSQWRLIEGDTPLVLEVLPLSTCRPFHRLAGRFDLGDPAIDARPNGFSIRWPGDRPPLFVDSNGAFDALPDWYYRFVLAAETDRGLDDQQDLFAPGPIRGELWPGDRDGLIVAASTAPVSWRDAAAVRSEAERRHAAAPLPPEVDDPLAVALARAADDFLVRRGDDQGSIIAGYPWFADWGRDAFISLPGLCLVTGRFAAARSIIDTFAGHLADGLIPNLFPDSGGQPEYNTVDATLWFINAIDRYVAYTGDWTAVADGWLDAIAEALAAHFRGTRHRIGVDADGLLAAGEPGVQLTWMDARVDGRVVTPRIGKPVEINALWYNALRIASRFAERGGRPADAARWTRAAESAREAFNRRFWNNAAGCCFDVVDVDHVPGRDDPAIRPNQILALALTHPVLDESRWPAVVGRVREKLWTPLGLRTLDPEHPDFRPRYRGDARQRDGAYHQGTVWPWLLGPFVSAYVRAHGPDAAARRAARRLLDGLDAHLVQAGLGSISEVGDGAPPHLPGGCPWQAWSVAEPLRALVEDVFNRAPRSPAETRAAPRDPISAAISG